MNPEAFIFAVTLMLFTLSVGLLGYDKYRPYRGSPVQQAPEPAVQIPEIPPLDPMVPCPECKLMGYHSLDFVRAQPPAPIATTTLPDGEVLEFHTWQSAGGVSAHYRRECIFCTNTWSVPVGAG